MGAIAYDGYQLTPAPMVGYSKNYLTSADGNIIGSTFQITLDGKFLPNMGSPTSSGTLYTQDATVPNETVATTSYMTALLRKQEALRSLFSNPGKTLRVKGWDGGLPFTCNPRLKTPIEFPRGNGQTSWANIADYRVILEADVIYFGNGTIEDSGDVNNYKIETAESNWNIEPENYDLGSYRLTRQISAKGKRFYSSSGTLDKQAWENARDYVLNSLTLSLNNQFMSATGVLNNSNLTAYNCVRSQSVNELGGTFSANVTWLAFNASGFAPALDEFEVTTKSDMNGLANVSLQGKVTGLAVTNNSTGAITSGKYTNAVNKFNSISNTFLARASGYAGTTLRATPLSSTVGRNPITGVITYSYEYDNRPANTISGSLSENVTVSFSYPQDIFCSLPVLGRSAGPVLQSIQTITSNKKSVTIEAVLPSATQTSVAFTKPDTNSLASGFVPTATWVFKDNDQEVWNPYSGKYSRQISWTYNS